jgi:hypothetical protein
MERSFDVSAELSDGCLGIDPIRAGVCTFDDASGIRPYDVLHRLAETRGPCCSDLLLSLGCRLA